MSPPRHGPQGPASQQTADTVRFAEHDTLELKHAAPPPPPSAWEQARPWVALLWRIASDLLQSSGAAWRRARRGALDSLVAVAYREERRRATGDALLR